MSKPTVVSDSSTLILITKANLLALLIDAFQIIIPEVVYHETVIVGREDKHLDAIILDKAIREGKIKVKKPKKVALQKLEEFNLKGAENYVLALALTTKSIAVWIDDSKGIAVCKKLGLNFLTAPAIVLSLNLSGILNKEEASDKLDLLAKYGWYKYNQIQRVKEELQ